MQSKKTFLWICRIIPAILLLQTAFFKFIGSPASVFIFAELGKKPNYRINAGVMDLIIILLLLLPTTYVYGAVMAIIFMLIIIYVHVFRVGIEVMNDNGLLFIYALIILVCSLCITWISRSFFATFKKNAALNINNTDYIEEKKGIKNRVLPAIGVIIALAFWAGIIGLVYAVESKRNLRQLNFEEAKRTSLIADIWVKIGCAFGIVNFLIAIIRAALKTF